MNLEQQESYYRVIVALGSLIVAAVFIGAVTLTLTAAGAPGAVEALLGKSDSALGRLFPATIQNLMWLLFWVGAGELVFIRFYRARAEMAQLGKGLLPEGDNDTLRERDLGDIYREAKREGHKHFFLQRLIARVRLQFAAGDSVAECYEVLSVSMELMQHELELKYNMLRYLVWLIPTIGFIGTVIGIAFALGLAADMPDLGDSGAIREWLGGLTVALGVAFWTTFLALLMSAVLVFMMHIVQALEESALSKAGEYCTDNLIIRLIEQKRVDREREKLAREQQRR